MFGLDFLVPSSTLSKAHSYLGTDKNILSLAVLEKCIKLSQPILELARKKRDTKIPVPDRK